MVQRLLVVSLCVFFFGCDSGFKNSASTSSGEPEASQNTNYKIVIDIPPGTTFQEGDRVFLVSAFSGPQDRIISYDWQRRRADQTWQSLGLNSNTLAFLNFEAMDSGTYRVQITFDTDLYGEVTIFSEPVAINLAQEEEPETPPQNVVRVGLHSVTASADDGNGPQNAVDNELNTRWSAEGDGQYIDLFFDARYEIKHVDIAYYRGDVRDTTIELQLEINGTLSTVYSGTNTTRTLEFVRQLINSSEDATRLRLIGYGNTDNSWNSISEIQVWGVRKGDLPPQQPGPGPTPEPEPEPEPEPDPNAVGACNEYGNMTFDPADFDNVLENFERSTTLRLVGSQWDNTLVRNCTIDGVDGDGIFIRDVKNVVITGCTVQNVSGVGMKTSSSGSSEDVIFIGNTIRNTGSSGMHVPQRVASGVNSSNVIVANNSFSETGLSGTHGGYHGIYSQSQNVIISGNHIFGSRDGNGISFRSSGKISCNKVEGTSGDNKPGIRYFSDHETGDPSVLVIENNVVSGQSMGIHLYNPTERYDGQTSYDHVVKTFIIRNNTVSDNDTPIGVDSVYNNNPLFSVTLEGNQ